MTGSTWRLSGDEQMVLGGRAVSRLTHGNDGDCRNLKIVQYRGNGENMRISDKEDGFTHRMPAHFMVWKPDAKGSTETGGFCPYDDCTFIQIRYRTDKKELSRYVPEEFELVEPEVLIGYMKCNAVQFMGGSEYSLVSIAVPVRYLVTKDRVEGIYPLVIWEDNTTPILGGREEAGMPKIFADIHEYRQRGKNLSVNVSHEGRSFLELELTREEEIAAAEIAKMNENHGRIVQFGWRYIPKVGPFTGASLSEATYYPVDNEIFSGSVCSATVKWTPLRVEQHPLQAGIIAALAQLPVLDYLPGAFKKGKCWMRMDLARSLP
jgi:hypothetical protein